MLVLAVPCVSFTLEPIQIFSWLWVFVTCVSCSSGKLYFFLSARVFVMSKTDKNILSFPVTGFSCKWRTGQLFCQWTDPRKNVQNSKITQTIGQGMAPKDSKTSMMKATILSIPSHRIICKWWYCMTNWLLISNCGHVQQKTWQQQRKIKKKKQPFFCIHLLKQLWCAQKRYRLASVCEGPNSPTERRECPHENNDATKTWRSCQTEQCVQNFPERCSFHVCIRSHEYQWLPVSHIVTSGSLVHHLSWTFRAWTRKKCPSGVRTSANSVRPVEPGGGITILLCQTSMQLSLVSGLRGIVHGWGLWTQQNVHLDNWWKDKAVVPWYNRACGLLQWSKRHRFVVL